MAKVGGAVARTLGDPYSNGREKEPDAVDADWTEVLAEVPIFADLSKRHVRAITKLAKVQRLAPFTKIVREGASADSFFLVLEGVVVVRPPGKRPVKLGTGDFFGELALLDDSPRSATVEAVGDVLVARIGRKDFLRLLEKEPKVAFVLLRTLAVRLRSSEASPKH
jgi:monovalent cation:H+ antiporter, CPA1 family